MPDSVTLTPLIAVAPASVTVAVVGAVMDGAPLTVIPTTCCVAELPKLSVAFSVSVSGLVVGSVSCRPPSEVFTSPKSPLIVRVLPPLLETTESEPETDAASVPAVSDTTTVKVSGDPGLPVSDTLRPARGLLLPTPVVSEVGTVSTGTLFTVTAMFFTGAEPPRLSVAFTVIVSEPADASRSASVASDAFTSVSDPLIVSCVLPSARVTVSAPDCEALSAPLVSFSTTVNVSPASAPASLMLTPGTAAEWLTPTVRVVGAVIVGPLITVIGTSPAGALLPKLSVAVTAI